MYIGIKTKERLWLLFMDSCDAPELSTDRGLWGGEGLFKIGMVTGGTQ